ncbi:MAG: hypothetical protein ACRYFS_07005 [Janthinobacterium lividum]
MNRKKFLLFLGGVLSASLPLGKRTDAAEPDEKKEPPTYNFELIAIADTTPRKWIIVWLDVGYESLSSPQLRFAIPQLPKGTTLIWPTQCKVNGEDGIVFGPSKQELNIFQSYCKQYGIVFHQSIP